jgi:hypothetical protein
VFPDGEEEPVASGSGGEGGGGGVGGGGGGDLHGQTGEGMEHDRSSSSSEEDEAEERRKFVPPFVNNPVIVTKLPFPKTNLSGVKGQFEVGTNPCDVPTRLPANLPSAGKLAGQTDSVISSYNAVAALRKVERVNPSLSGGGRPKIETSQIGSFKTNGDGRLGVSHFLTIVEKKQNISFSFDPKTLICSSCSGRGGHPVGGGGVETRQVFVLSDQNFPSVLPCSMGECLKIIRVEDGGLGELVNVWLDITKGREFPAGSVVVLCSASHLTLHGVSGYISDLAVEFSRIENKFRGGVICFPGVPILGGGSTDSFFIRSLFELEGWLKASSDPYPRETWELLLGLMRELSLGGVQAPHTSKVRLPDSLRDFRQGERTWVSEGWTNLPNGVQPFQQEHESKVVCSLINELNGMFNLDLGKEPGFDRFSENAPVADRPRILLIGASHVVREGDILADRGYEVTLVSKPGWRATKGAVDEMVEKVKEALVNLSPHDVVVVQLLDNISYLARSDEGGDLPIRRYVDGVFHIEGDLVLAGKDRQFMTFQNLEPLLRVLEGWRVFLLTPMPRFLREACCDELEHAPNRYWPGFEEGLRKNLAEFRSNHKDFLFTRGFRGFKVIDPSPALPNTAGENNIWGEDPVHPLTEGYERVVDLLEKEIMLRSAAGSKRTAPEAAGGQVKKPRMEVPRPSWIEGSSLSAKRTDVGAYRGRGGGGRGGGGGGSGRGGAGGGNGPGFRGGRGFFPRGRGGRGRFYPPGYY